MDENVYEFKNENAHADAGIEQNKREQKVRSKEKKRNSRDA